MVGYPSIVVSVNYDIDPEDRIGIETVQEECIFWNSNINASLF